MKASSQTSILIIYTGGTIGMTRNRETGALESFDFEHLRGNVPEMSNFDYHIEAITLNPPIDSSDMEPSHWAKMARLIEKNYETYDGFVILHGTDTMAYTASALSFMLQGLAKPVVITGSQIPIGQLRTDGKENFLTSIEIAAAKDKEGQAMVPEVCIYFESQLMRGNRTTKINSEGFNAFRSFNFPCLANAGIDIKYDTHLVRRPPSGSRLKVESAMDNRIIVVTLFPGIREDILSSLLHVESLRGVILKTYGSGNAPQKPWLMHTLEELCRRGVVVVNVTQCKTGSVQMRRYETGLQLLHAGVLNGFDCTIEAMVTKMMFLLGRNLPLDETKRLMCQNIAGEITLPNE